MSRPARLVVAWTAGAAVVAFVVMVALGVLPHAGTGQFLDPWRGLADTLARPRTWVVPGIAAVVGAVAGVVHVIVTRRRGK